MGNLVERFRAVVNAWRFPRAYSGGWADLISWGRTRINFKREAGDPTESSVVMACVRWIIRQWPRSPFAVYETDSEGNRTAVHGHLLAELIANPNPWYGGATLWMGTVLSLNLDGNAYWYVLRNRLRAPVGLLYLPHHQVEPKPDPDGVELIGYYEFDAGDGKKQRLEVGDVVHFRDGLDPKNIRKGMAPLKSLLLEIFTDNEAAAFSAIILRNLGVPGVAISPKPNATPVGQSAKLDGPKVAELKKQYQEKFSGDGRGEPWFSSIPWDVVPLSFSPQQLNLQGLRQMPEARVSGVIGIPAIVAGLWVGLEHSTYNNVTELRKLAYDNNILPTHELVATEVDRALLPEFETDPRFSSGFDTSRVPDLQEDKDKAAARWGNLWQRGVAMRGEARAKVGLQAGPEDDVYIFDVKAAAMPALPPGADPPAGDEDEKKPPPGGKKRLPPPERKRAGQAKSLLEVAGDFRASLLRREEKAVADIESAYEVAAKGIQAELDKLTAAMEKAVEAGEEISEAWLFRQERYHALLSQIEERLGELGATATERVTDEQDAVVIVASDHGRRLSELAAGEKPKGATLPWNRLSREAMDTLIGFASDDGPLAELFADLAPGATNATRDALVSGIALGKNPRETARDIQAAVGGTRTRAVNIARTETLRAYREASRQSYQANEDVVEGWIWHAAADGETCACCWAMHGTEHPLSETLDDHQQGRCSMLPKTVSWADILGDDTLPDTRPVVPAGDALFADLGEDEQRTILGDEAFGHWQAGTITLSDMVTQTHDQRWGSTRRQATVAEALAHAAQRA